MHNGFINIDNEKMSKSLGNFFTIRDVLKRFDAETVRFFIAARALPQRAQLSATCIWTTRAPRCAGSTRRSTAWRTGAGRRSTGTSPTRPRFAAAMDDDFDTPDGGGRAVRAGRRGQSHALGRAGAAC